MNLPLNPPASIRDLLNARWVTLILVCLTGLGLYLRIRNLGELGFRWDEDITALAVKAILENGYPLFPTGMIYLRSAPFLYVLALSASLFGVDEFALRLPPVLFSTATIPLAYYFATRLFGRPVGLAVAAMISGSFWELEMARSARMYAPFAFFYLLTVFAFYHYYVDGEGRWRSVTVVLALITITFHQLGFSLAFLFLFPLLFNNYHTVSRRHLFLNFILVSAFFLSWRHLLNYLHKIPVRIHLPPGGLPGYQETGDLSIFEYATAFLVKILAIFDFPSFELLENLYQTSTSAFIIVTLGFLALAAFYLARTRRAAGTDHLLIILILLSCYTHQFTLALLFFFIYLFIQNEGILGLRSSQMLRLAVAVVASFALWLVYGIYFGEPNVHVISGESTHFRQTVRALLDYPQFRIVWRFFLERPIMSCVAAFGVLWSFHLAAQKAEHRNALFLILAFFAPLLAGGLFDTQYQQFRYVLHLDVFYFIFFALGLARWHAITQLIFAKESAHWSLSSAQIGNVRTRIVVTGVALLIVLSFDLNPVKTWLSTQRDYYEPSSFIKPLDLDYYPDHKTPALYVKDRLSDDDIVIVLDAREQYNYIGRTDYWIRTAIYETQTYLERGQLRDLYVGTPLITSLQELRRIIRRYGDRRIWLIASSRKLRRTKAVSADIVRFIDGLSKHVVYVGKDRVSNVYLLEARSEIR